MEVKVDVDGGCGFVELQEKLGACVVEGVMKGGVVLNGEMGEQFTEDVREKEENVGFMQCCVFLRPGAFA